jgi:hypothetical protein
MQDGFQANHSKTDGSGATAEIVADGDTDRRLSTRALYFGIFLTSAAVLVLQISLTRIFSYTIWYHFTYVTISLAMLGFGASGAVLAASRKLSALDMKLAHYSSLTGAAAIPFMLVIVSKVPFQPFRLFNEPLQVPYMALYYLAVTLPFFCAGMTISCAFKSIPKQASKIYFWDLVGAGTGCFAVVSAIHLLGVPGVAAISASLFLLAAALFQLPRSRLRKLAVIAAAIIWLPLGANVEKALEFKASEEKWISRIEGKKVTFTRWSPIFRVDAYELPPTKDGVIGPDGMNYGIKNKYFPRTTRYAFIAHDGDACAMMINAGGSAPPFEMFDKSILKPPYLLIEDPDSLIIGPGGGVDVAVALQSNARSITAVELDPITVDLVSGKYADFVGGLYQDPRVNVVVDEGRSFLRRADEKYDIVQMTGVDTLAALNSGAYVLAENYLYTVNAYNEFMDHLTERGILSIAIFDAHYTFDFPRHVARQVALSVTTLRERGISEPYKHIAIIASSHGELPYPYVLILTKMMPFTLSEIRTLTEFSNELSYDIWYLPGRTPDNAPAYIATSSKEELAESLDKSPWKLVAPTDEAPFFFHFYKWKTLMGERKIDTGHTQATGQLILLLILVLSVSFSAAFIIFPLFKFRKTGLETKWKWNYILYFAALGLGFIFLEISYIQRFILFLGYPTYSLTVILFSLLSFSGIGSYISGKLSFAPRNLIVAALCLLAIVALSYLVILPPIFNHFLGATKQVRIVISLILLFPLGLLLGMFFPTGIKIISEDNERFIPWAWGINGCASVIGTVLSIIIAMSHGFGTVTILSVIIYAVGIAAMYRACGERSAELA